MKFGILTILAGNCLNLKLPNQFGRIQSEVMCAESCNNNNLICYYSFETVVEYLNLLEAVSKQLGSLGERACLYLAAAVSDFYIPWDKMVEHKIQSSNGGLTLQLDQVPKKLALVTREWAPRCYVVSFKLETDESLVIEKAKGAIENYGVHLVVANQLQTRRDVVYLVDKACCNSSASSSSSSPQPLCRPAVITRPLTADLIEKVLVDAVSRRHLTFYCAANRSAGAESAVDWHTALPPSSTTPASSSSPSDKVGCLITEHWYRDTEARRQQVSTFLLEKSHGCDRDNDKQHDKSSALVNNSAIVSVHTLLAGLAVAGLIGFLLGKKYSS